MSLEKESSMPDSKSSITSMPVKTGLSFGEKLVGLSFNPSGDPLVNDAKRLCANLADLLHDYLGKREVGELDKHLVSHTYGEILNAQMNVVKVLTLKY